MAPTLQGLHMWRIIPKAKNFNTSHVHKQNHFVWSYLTASHRTTHFR